MALLPSLLSCTQLDPYPEGVCGNAVVDRELFEQCDTHTLGPGQACGAPGSPGACRYTCAIVDAGVDPVVRATCPAGFACGLDDLCHRAAGTFERSSVDDNLALASRLGDFDGDGALDVLTAGLSRLDASFYDDDGALASRQTLGGSLTVPPAVVDLAPQADGDGRFDDLVFASGGDVVVALGGEDGLTPKSYAGIRLGLEPPTFFFFVPGGLSPFVDIDASFALAERPSGDGLRLIRLDDQSVSSAVAAWPIDEIPTGAVTADYDTTSPGCEEVVFGYARSIATFRPCVDGQTGGIPASGALPDPVTLRLEAIPGDPDRRLVSAPALVRFGSEVDGFGHAVIVEVNECEEDGACNRFDETFRDCCATYVGWAVPEIDPDPDDGVPPGFGGRFSSEPFGEGELDTLGRFGTLAEGDLALHPLAWGDFNADDIPDFVTPGGAYIGVILPGVDGGYAPVLAAFNPGFPWSDATVADIDGDGFDDVVAVPTLTPALTYLRGTAVGTMTFATIQVERPYSEVRAGDVDGDGRKDIVGRTVSADGTREELGVLYFSDGTFTAPRTIGTFPIDTRGTPDRRDDRSSVLQLTSGKTLTTFDAIDDIAVITTYPDAAGEQRVGIALFEGRADRQLVAPITVIDRGATTNVFSAAVGRFEAGLPTIVADAFQIDLDENLEIRGSSRPIGALDGGAMTSWFPEGVSPGSDTLYAAADFDGLDATDELMVGVPGCVEYACVDEATGDERTCCEAGTETSRIFLFERGGGDFVPSRFAGNPIELTGLSARAYRETFGLRLGRLRPTDLDGDLASEALVMLGSRASGALETKAYLVHLGAAGLVATPLPAEVTVDGASQPVNVFGFSVTTGGDGAPLVLLATSHGLFSTRVEVSGKGAEATFTFEAAVPVLDATGQPLASLDVSAVEAGDLNGDGIDDLVLTRPFSTEVFLGQESLDPPLGTP